MKIQTIILLSFIILINACKKDEEAANEIIKTETTISPNRIAWDYSTLQVISENHAGYARMIELQNGDFVCGYGVPGALELVRSTDKGKIWSEPIVVVKEKVHPSSGKITWVANSELTQLSDGRLIYSYNHRPADPYSLERRFAIAFKISEDNGLTWGNEIMVYEASHNAWDGCWEPQVLQLNSGEVQIYFANEAPYTSDHDQEITMMRALNDDLTQWDNPEKIAYVAGSRDGMPVALELDNGEIIMSIEDPSVYNFKPAIIRTINNWANAPVDINSPDREYALNHDLNNYVYQGAPYICRLPSGNIALSYQGTEGAEDNDMDSNAKMYVEVGDIVGRNFDSNSLPFNVPFGRSGLWNSIATLNNRIWALTSTDVNIDGSHAERKSRVWAISGYEITECKIPSEEINVDGEIDESSFNVDFFVGHKSESNVSVELTHTDFKLFVSAIIKDESVYSSNGIIINIDPENISSVNPVSDIYSFTVMSNGSFKAMEGYNGLWQDSDINAEELQVKKVNNGYIVEFSVSWDSIGGKPLSGERIGFNISLIETAYTEDLVNSDRDKPYTWATVKL